MHVWPGREAEEQQSDQRPVHPVSDRDPVSVEGSGQLLRRDAADDDTRQICRRHIRLFVVFGSLIVIFVFVPLQPCRGSKMLHVQV